MHKQIFTLHEPVMLHGERVYIVKERHYRLPDSKNKFGIHYGINRSSPNGKAQFYIDEALVSKIAEENITYVNQGMSCIPVYHKPELVK